MQTDEVFVKKCVKRTRYISLLYEIYCLINEVYIFRMFFMHLDMKDIKVKFIFFNLDKLVS